MGRGRRHGRVRGILELDWFSRGFGEALKLLKDHPEGIIAVVMVGAGVAMYLARVEPLFAFGLPVAIYLLYHFRMTAAAGHKERLAEMDVKRIESSAGNAARKRVRNAISRKRKTDGNH